MPVYVTCVQHCVRVVTKLLLTEPTLAVAMKHHFKPSPCDILLLQISTPNQRAYVFDLKKTPDLMHEGQLWRLLVSPDVTKVIHDCRAASAALRRQFRVTLHGVFDTQAAYCVAMIHSGLPPRLISLDQLYYKYGEQDDAKLDMLQESLSGTGLYWAQRPLSKDMLREAAADVTVLLPQLYTNLRGELCEKGLEDMQELTYAYIHGYFQPGRNHKGNATPRIDTHSPLLKLSEGQKHLLEGTIGGCSAR